MLQHLLGAVALLASVLSQQASYTYFDQQTPYTNPPFELRALNTPVIGTTFRLEVPQATRSCPPSRCGTTDYFLFTGTRLFMPFDSGLLRRANSDGWLYVDALEVFDTMQLPTSGQFRAEYAVSVPNDAALVGVEFCQQVLEAHIPWPGAPYDFRLSRMGIGVIGT